MAKQKRYQVGVTVAVWLETEVQAESAEQALQKARELQFKDLLRAKGIVNDFNIRVVGVQDPASLSAAGF